MILPHAASYLNKKNKMNKIETIEDLKAFLLEAIDVCTFEIKKIYECGAGKLHPDFENLSCAKWIYERLLERVSCDKQITETICDKDITEGEA